MTFDRRRVVAGLDDAGFPGFLSDGMPPATSETPAGLAVSDLLWLDGPPAGGAAGGEPAGMVAVMVSVPVDPAGRRRR